ncbi:transposase [Aeromonas jandaei]|uniref:transposase n=1 Tax=Aeromonas jandaei TaxID=650 RepID=UPI003BA361B2
MEAVANKIGCSVQTLSNWIRKSSASTTSVSPPTDVRIKELEPENRELKRANEIFKLASAFLHRRSSTAV